MAEDSHNMEEINSGQLGFFPLKSVFLVGFQFCDLTENVSYEGWNFNSGNYLFTTDTK